MSEPLLKIDDLTISLGQGGGSVPLVKGLSFEIAKGETLCLVGESGCGKSVTALSIIGLLNKAMRVTDGRILFQGQDLLTFEEDRLRQLRGDRIAMVFQEPMTSLNPVHRIGRQIAEVIVAHRGVSNMQAERDAIRLLDLVRIPDAARRAHEFPHQLSGGMRQRVMIAMALALKPALLIADEPTTALDVTIQAQVLALMDDLRREFDTSLLLITHDLGVVAEMADRVLVLYAGRKVEQAGVSELFDQPRHPYSAGLLSSISQLLKFEKTARLTEIPGTVPNPAEAMHGCAFRERCSSAHAQCARVQPQPVVCDADHEVACLLYTDQGATA